MSLVIAAIRSGTEAWGPLPPGAFHRVLDEPLACPKCDASYSLIVDFDQAGSRFFDESARPLLLLLRKAVFLGHADGHRVTHFETGGVVVRAIGPPQASTQPARRVQEWA